jgi:glyceraldehyde-3-phosphate dehydrogenase/erythrose-4-phosphate dehydrogenase
MTTKVATNGLGRIARAILKSVIDEPSWEPAAVNDLVNAGNRAYLRSTSVQAHASQMLRAAVSLSATVRRPARSPERRTTEEVT